MSTPDGETLPVEEWAVEGWLRRNCWEGERGQPTVSYSFACIYGSWFKIWFGGQQGLGVCDALDVV